MASLAFAFPLTPGKAKEWRSWGRGIVGRRRREYDAFRRRVGLTAQRVYLQHTPQGDLAIFYLEGKDPHRALQELAVSQDPFVVWFRQQAQDLLEGLDWAQISLGSPSQLVFDGPSVEEDQARDRALYMMERLGETSP